MGARRFGTVLSLLALALAAGTAACVVGFRAQAEFMGSESLAGVSTVQLRLPQTPMEVIGSPVVANMGYEGTWHATGGTAKEAERNATRAGLVFTAEEGVGRLQADIPLEVSNLVDLEMGEIRLPEAVDVEIETSKGDVSVGGISGAVSIGIDVGDVSVTGGDGGVDVQTVIGSINLLTPGFADVETASGDVDVAQNGSPRDLYVLTESGNASIRLASDANLDLTIEAKDIRVRTDLIRTTTEGEFSRRTGNATNRVEIRAPGGVAEVFLVDGS